MIYFPTIDSTNAEMHRRLAADALEHGTCIVADYQSAGHGQASNHWESADGKNLLFSILLHPREVAVADQFVITEIVSLAIRDALDAELDKTVRNHDEIAIKWPNDIYIGNKKVCGVLIENSVCGNALTDCIIGAGINVNQTVFTSDAPNPVSLANISGTTHDRNAILTTIYTAILDMYDRLASANDLSFRHDLHNRYMSHLYRRNGVHAFRRATSHAKNTSKNNETEIFRASIDHIDSFGLLALRLENGATQTFAFKEIAFI